MLKERRAAAQQVADQLFAAEAAIDAAIAATATLAALMPTVRTQAGAGACIGQDALLKAVATIGKLSDARTEIVATHAALRVAQRQIGLDAVAFGGMVEKIGTPPGENGPQGRLKVVETQQARVAA
ncbi:hypothetical protein [Glacieibacterium frigidum]|uniref:hypothetical protein n=1 Tax=Glacieibacterium frigidum TaxID=2593303 RepID=UPI00163D9C64|nr:hypothetical protein [Glacieibacterium frigidum]